MKRNKCLYVVVVFVLLGLFAYSSSAQDEAQLKQIAKRLVRSAGVNVGDVVIVEGGKHMIPLMEAVAIEVQMVGGKPNMFLDSDRVGRSFWKDVPEKFLEIEPRYYADWLKHTDVYIFLPGTEDSKALFADIPAERMVKAGKASSFFMDVLNSLPVREVDIDYPTRSAAEIAGMDLTAYQKLMFEGINADYDAISSRGAKLQSLLKQARQLRITTPAGTDLTFAMAPGRGVFLDDGMVTAEEAKAKTFTERYVLLPGGSIYFSPLETSANGRVVVPRTNCRFSAMDKATFDVKDGKMVNFNGGSNGPCFDEMWKAFTGQHDIFGSVWIGLNPGLRVVEDEKANFRHTNIAGMVSIGFGDNRQYGGALTSVGGSGYALTNATVTADGKTIVKDGKLIF